MNFEVLVQEKRAELLENVHIGMICGVNDQFETKYQVGDTEHYTFFRSASKLIQALPAFLSDIITKYGLTEEEATLLTASHRGEEYHIAALESMLKKLPIIEEELFCPPSYPLNVKPREEMIRNGLQKRSLYHNCAGKHMGFLTVCREMGFPTEGYWEIHHPLQQQILTILSELSNVPVSDIKVGTDGCGVPVFAIPLKNMAITYLKLSSPELIDNSDLKRAVKRMTGLMNKHPKIVASEKFICTTLLEDSNIVAKGGAQGVYCFGLKKERLGFALKVANGSEDVWPNIVSSILEQINYSNSDTINRLRELKPGIIKNDGGVEVGSIREVFTLSRI